MSAGELRPIDESDVDALHALDQLCFEPGIAYTRGEIRRFLGLPTARGLVLEDGARVVAFAIGYRPERRRGSVLTLDVHPEFRTRGVGKRLLSEIVVSLVRDGAREITLEVDVRNRGAIAFYERFGFRTIATLSDYYGPGRDAFEMAMPAAAPAMARRGDATAT